MNQKEKTFLYIVRLYNEEESFYKVGITSREDVSKRISSFPYEVEVIDVFFYPFSGFIKNLEEHLLSLEEKHTPLITFGGYSECIKSIDNVLEFLNTISWMKDFKRHKLLKRCAFSRLVKDYLANLDTEHLKILRQDDRCTIIEEAIEIFGIEKVRRMRPETFETKVTKYHDLLVLKDDFKSKYKKGDILSNEDLKQEFKRITETYSLTTKFKISDISSILNSTSTSVRLDGKKYNAIKIVEFK